jgi:ribosome-associated protein
MVECPVTASVEALQLVELAARAASERKAKSITAIDVSERLALTDAFVIAAGDSERQVLGIVEKIEEDLHLAGVDAIRREGVTSGRWVLLDFGEIVVHVQHADDYEYYDLERLWKDCPAIDIRHDEAEDHAPTNTDEQGIDGTDHDDADIVEVSS